MKKIKISTNMETQKNQEIDKELAEALACFKDICQYSQTIFNALVLKCGKENDLEEKIDENSVLKTTIDLMEHFVKCVKPKIS